MRSLTGEASACASATVVNAIATGKGAAFGVDLRVKAKAKLIRGERGVKGHITGADSESPRLIEICARKVMEELGIEKTHGAKIETDQGIPIAVGLSSSSAAANAAVLATLAAAGADPDIDKALEIGIDAAFEAGVTVTGALDDAAASIYGCGVITDNLKRKILKKFRISRRLDVLIYIPPAKSYSSKIRTGDLRPIKEAADFAHEMAMKGRIMEAMMLNGALYAGALNQDPTPAIEAIAEGALAAGLTGTGTATVAIVRPDDASGIEKIWGKRAGRIIKTKPALRGAMVDKHA
ncbi:MAG: shikimate kinase [Candidatus Hadarchaeales archaeon]